MNDRLPGASWSNPIWYREKWRIYIDDFECAGEQFAFVHDDFDVAIDAKDTRYGHGQTIEDCKKQIDEEFYDE